MHPICLPRDSGSFSYNGTTRHVSRTVQTPGRQSRRQFPDLPRVLPRAFFHAKDHVVDGNHQDPPHRPVLFRIFFMATLRRDLLRQAARRVVVEMRRSAMNSRTTILLADSQVMVRDLLARWLRSISDFEVVGVVGEAAGLVTEVVRLQPDVLLFEVDMPGLDVVEAARTIQARCPGTRIILLDACRHGRRLQQTLAAVSGYVTHNDPPDALVRAIRGPASRHPYYPKGASTSRIVSVHGAASCPVADSGEPGLSQRELEVIRYLATGLSKKEIARFMHISVNTVNRHTENLMAKLDIHDRVRLTRYAMQEGLLEPQAL